MAKRRHVARRCRVGRAAYGLSDYAHQETTVAPPADQSSHGHREADVEESFDRGRARTRRPWVDLLATGGVGGIEVGFGVLALLSVEMTGSKLQGEFAFSIGFIALLLGHSELFTEGFLIPVPLSSPPRPGCEIFCGSGRGHFSATWPAAWCSPISSTGPSPTSGR